MEDIRFNVHFISVSDISGQWEGNNERLRAMKSRLRSERLRFRPNSNSDENACKNIAIKLITRVTIQSTMEFSGQSYRTPEGTFPFR